MSAVQPASPLASAPDAGLFGPDSVTWRIHGDPSMAVAGFRALLLQAVHPLVMAGFDANSGFRADPWGRLQRTGEWIATVTYGTTAEAEAAGAMLRRLHGRLVPGIEPETGRTYRVDDPDLLLWVHCTEVESFLTTYRRCGGRLTDAEADQYVEEMRASARLVGLDTDTVPRTVREIEEYYERVRPDLHLTAVARRNTLWSFAPPMPRWVSLATPARPAWVSLMAMSAAMLPVWARRLHGLPGLALTDVSATVVARIARRSLSIVPGDRASSPAHRAALRRVAGDPVGA
ncbi:MAG: oxygenase MpaB family protein [Nocardioidaceae bacterium]